MIRKREKKERFQLTYDPERRFVSIVTCVIRRQLLVGAVLGFAGVLVLTVALVHIGRGVAGEYVASQNKLAASQLDMIFQEMNAVIKALESDHEVVSLFRSVTSGDSLSEQDLEATKTQLSICLSEYQSRYNNIQGNPFLIYVDEKTRFGSIGAEKDPSIDLLTSSPGFQRFMDSRNDIYVSGTISSLDGSEAESGQTEESSYAFCRKCILGGRYVTVVAMTSYTRIGNLLDDTFFAGEYTVTDMYGYPVLPAGARMLEPSAETLKTLDENYSYSGTASVRMDGGNWFLRKTTVGGWWLIRRLTDGDLIQPYTGIIWLSILILVIVVLAIMLVTTATIHRKLSPLQILLQHMKELQNGNFKIPLVIHTADEIEELSNSYNEMRIRLNQFVKKTRKQEKEEGEMRYALMLSQLDPHFIYNTMNTITVLASQGRNEDVIETNHALIQIMKDTLHIAKGDVLGSVAHEVEMGENYIIIQRYRYSDQFVVEWDVDPAVQNVRIPRAIIQPLVENAIFHGLMGGKSRNELAGGGYICVAIGRENDYLRISVSDDGVGMTQEQLAALNQSTPSNDTETQVTVANIRYRLQYLYGDQAIFSVKSAPGEGTEVTIMLPVLES